MTPNHDPLDRGGRRRIACTSGVVGFELTVPRPVPTVASGRLIALMMVMVVMVVVVYVMLVIGRVWHPRRFRWSCPVRVLVVQTRWLKHGLLLLLERRVGDHPGDLLTAEGQGTRGWLVLNRWDARQGARLDRSVWHGLLIGGLASIVLIGGMVLGGERVTSLLLSR